MLKTHHMTASSPSTSSRENNTMRKTPLALLCAALVGVAAVTGTAPGCALTASPDINRVQPNYTKKTQFAGEWYMLPIVVQKQYAASFPFEGYQGELERVRFEISEGRLDAFRSYERAPGTETDDAGSQTLIASFPILSHFDIRRQYNATNGVENNVIEENTIDRPWWEREYIRVDWSQNTAPSIAGLDRWLADITTNETDRSTNPDPTDPFRVRLEDDYMETTIDTVMHPDWGVCEGLGPEMFACQPARARIKYSFMRVEDRGYEPLHFPDRVVQKYGTVTNVFGDVSLCFEGDEGCEDYKELWTIYTPYGEQVCDPNYHDPDDCFQRTTDVFTKFGFFRTDRHYWDRQIGSSVSAREQLINRWNIWETAYDADGNLLPYAERTPKTIVYYLNTHYPESLIPAAQLQADDWSEAFISTIAALQNKTVEQVQQDYSKDGRLFRGYEVRVNDCNAENVRAYVEMAAGQADLEMDLAKHGFSTSDLGVGVLEHVCSTLEYYSEARNVLPRFEWQRFGDIRYSFINWIDTPEPAGPLGYGPSGADPLTGEIVVGNANMYGASVDTYANWGADIVQLLNGELSEEDIINGSHIREHIESVRMRFAQKTSDETAMKFAKLIDERTAHFSDESYLTKIPVQSINSNLDRVRDSGFEAANLVNEEALALFGDHSNGATDDESVARASPSSWARKRMPPAMRNVTKYDDLNVLQSSDQMKNSLGAHADREDFFGRHNFCYFAEQVEPAVAELAVSLEGKTREQAVQIIRANIMRGVLAHEVGHTVGLRHNFEGSSDALNFFPAYWGVETGDDRDSDNTRVEELAYSSIMDYHQRFNGDFGGIGLYDRAAIKFGYGQLVEVFDESESSFMPRSNNNDWTEYLWLFSPYDLPYLLAGEGAVGLIEEEYERVNNEITFNNNNLVYIDVQNAGITPHAENLFKRTNITFDEWKRQDVMRFFGRRNADGSPLFIEVPYAYCSDAFAWGGNLTCNRFDMGATSQEIVENASEMYYFYYPFYTYMGSKRWNDWWNSPVNGWLARLYDRTYQPMRNAFTYFYYYRRSTAQIWPLFNDWSKAAHDGLNFLVNVIQTPDVGRHCLKAGMYVHERELAENETCVNEIEVPRGQGKEYKTRFTDELEYRPLNIGHVWDKILALQAITSNDAFFYRDFSNQIDRGAFSISFYRVFAPELLHLFSGMVMDDRSRYSPQVKINGTVEVVNMPFVNFRNETPIPAVGPAIKPSGSYILQNYALFWGMVGFSSTLDQTLDFAQRSRISYVGGSNDPVAEGVPEVVFTEPYSSLQYRSYAVDGNEDSLGFALLTDAKDFVETGDWALAKADVEADPADQDARARLAQADAVLADKLHMIELTMYLTHALEASN